MSKFYALLLFVFLGCQLSAEDLIPDSGFEKEDTLKKWHFSDHNLKKDAFSIIERSNNDAKYGKFALHLKDERNDNTNSSLFYIVSTQHLPFIAGTEVTFQAEVKPISASSAEQVGILLIAESTDGKRIEKKVGIDPAKLNQWQSLSTTIQLPENLKILFCYLNCSSGWGEMGEAFFDDIKLTSKSPFQNAAPFVSFFPLPEGWEVGPVWNGYSLESQKLKYSAGAKAWGGFTLRTQKSDSFLNCSSIPIDKLAVRIVLSKNLPLYVKLTDKSKVYTQTLPATLSDSNGNFHYIMPLKTSGMKQSPSQRENITIQIAEAQEPGECEIISIALVSTETSNTSPQAAQ